ncbi:hypothetical protein BGZ65_006792, partial [Modicella reniformis]
MLSTTLPNQQYIPSDLSYLEQGFEFNNHQAMLSTSYQFPADFVDNNDIQSLPSLMSPNSSIKDLSDNIDDDDEDTEDECFQQQQQQANSILSCATTVENAFSMQMMQQQLQSVPSYAAMAAMGPIFGDVCPQVPFQQYQQANIAHFRFQQQQQLPLQQLQHNFLPQTSTLYNSYNPAATAFEQSSAASFNFLLDTFEQQQLQRTAVSMFDQSLFIPHLESGATTATTSSSSSSSADSFPALMSPSASTLVMSPTTSWASISRETSPVCVSVPVVHRRPAFRSVKRRSGSTYSRSGSAAKTPRIRATVCSHTDAPQERVVSTEDLFVSHTHHHQADECASSPVLSSSPTTTTTTTTTTTDDNVTKRRRRIRQTKDKVKPTSFACDSPDCGKVFSRAYNLTSHMKTHSSDRPFECGSCHLAFARRHDRERH